MILFPLLLLACQSDLETYSGDFDGLRRNADRLYKAEITLYGYLGVSKEFPDELNPLNLYETQRELDADIAWQPNSKRIFVYVNDYDVGSCHDKYVKLTGKLLGHDSSHISVETVKLERLPDPSVGSLDTEISDPVSCFQ